MRATARPARWGPHVWRYLHTLAATYDPQSQRAAVGALLDNLPWLLPCPACSRHLERHYAEPAFCAQARREALRSREELVRWVASLHDRVNAHLGSRECPPTSCRPTRTAALLAAAALPRRSCRHGLKQRWRRGRKVAGSAQQLCERCARQQYGVQVNKFNVRRRDTTLTSAR